MNKVIQPLTEWHDEYRKYLIILIDRRDSEKRWAEKDSHKDYYMPKYLETKAQVEDLERGISECEFAVKTLHCYDVLKLIIGNLTPTEFVAEVMQNQEEFKRIMDENKQLRAAQV